MGSGLILLVIVAAWLAVLVPMALRSSESAESLSSVDRFSDAMRVLSRRDAAARARALAVAGPERLGSDVDDAHDQWDDEYDDWDDDLSDWQPAEGRFARARRVTGNALGAVTRRVPRRAGRRTGPLSPAARRRRLLAGLVVLAVATLTGGLLLSPELLVAHAVADLLVVLYLVQLRRLVRARSAAARRRNRRAQPRPVPAARQASTSRGPVHVEAAAGSERDVEPVTAASVEPVEQPVVEEPVVTAARHDEPVPVAYGLGAPWSPVPVPPPVYASAPVAARPRRTVDLTGAAGQPERSTAGERLPGMEDELPAADRGVEPRRAVNDW
ncbi:MAG TPA: hypothetical protein VM433_07495 [Mycobacteriales bacterium]|nr:hypothetical protein [Mycobacteriales bacterium]